MSRVISSLLKDTFHLIQLARETARQQGLQTQAEQLAPLVENLRTLATQASEPRPASPVSDMMMQKDYQTLLAAAQTRSQASGLVSPIPASSPTDRSQVIQAMANGGMTEVDIARQMGMTRDEVHLILSFSRR